MSGLIIPGGGGLAVPPEIVIERQQQEIGRLREVLRGLVAENQLLRRRLEERTGEPTDEAVLPRRVRRQLARRRGQTEEPAEP